MDSVIAATIPCPPIVYYGHWRGQTGAIEAARRFIVENNNSSLLSSLLPTTTTTELYVFAADDRLKSFTFSGLDVVQMNSFNPQQSHLSQRFLEAVRIRLIDDTVKATNSNKVTVHRFNSGFVLVSCSQSNEWSAGWDSHKPIVYTHLQLHIANTTILIQPILYSTQFVSLSSPSPGTPITLLPYGTPAYYLSDYLGPASALTLQFHDAFNGLGLGNWQTGAYIIAWIVVENKQGEDKGITIVYPASLCLGILNSTRSLPCLPQLPLPLQPSPQLPQRVPGPELMRAYASPSAFRTLTLSKTRDLNLVATAVGGYVDAVARDRERERERLKREREGRLDPPPPQPLQQDFYPSPPHSIPTVAPTTSTIEEDVQPPPPSSPPPPIVEEEQPSVEETPPEAPPPPPVEEYDTWTDFMGMDFSMEPQKGDAFEADFTDDDFSFFDKPASASTAAATLTVATTTTLATTTGLTPAAGPAPFGMSPPVFGDLSEEHHIPMELLPPSPGATPPHEQTPRLAPEVQVDEREPIEGIFDPIPFAKMHKVADGKYALGKFRFSLPTPPEEDPTTSDYFQPRQWYDVKTDPRIGVVKRLKRKFVGRTPPSKRVCLLPDWEPLTPPEAGDEEESEEEEQDEDEEQQTELEQRPMTPPPPYLPLGPSLLSTFFRHEELLPLSTPLRPPGSAVAPTDITSVPAPTGVPTPVSPAATLGSDKSLEATASSLAKEIVENGVWTQAWMAVNNSYPKHRQDVWPSDVKFVKDLLGNVRDLEMQSDIKRVFGEGVVTHALESPMISIGKGEAVIKILPTALRFWEKLGLGPKPGKKDVSAYVLFEDEQRTKQVQEWFNSLSAEYASKHFGQLGAVEGGYLPVRFDSSLRKTLASLPTPQNIIFLIITPLSTMTPSSTVLRQIFSAVRKYPHILFHLVPEQSIFAPSNLDMLASSIYNRILRPVDRVMARRLSDDGSSICRYFQDPAFTLARENKPAVTFSRMANATLDVWDRHYIMHVGYVVHGKWILSVCVDERGEAYDIGVWLIDEDSQEAHVVSKVWEFAMHFAKQANLEWRIVIARLGVLEEKELDAWKVHLTLNLDHPLHITIAVVEPSTPWIFFPLTRPSSPKTPNTKVSARQLFTDASSVTHLLIPEMPLFAAPPSLSDTIHISEEGDQQPSPLSFPLKSSSLVSISEGSVSMLWIHIMHISHSSTSSYTGTSLLQDIALSFYQLSVLASLRWKLCGHLGLPFHLAALETLQILLQEA